MTEEFGGVINREVQDSEPWWPEPALPEAGAPNVVVILLDDTGFSHLGCFGSVIDTPNFDRLADSGLRYTNFHTTALCSPTRACLLTGRNHHSVGMRAISNFDTGFPNMRGRIAPSAATLGEVLEPLGYHTMAVGKWHLAPMREASAAGPFTDWPVQRGFNRFYGFLNGETDQFHPELCVDNHFVDAPATPEEGYHVSEDLVDQSIDMIRNQTSLVPERPFFLYLAFGATHAPHQAPDEYLAKYRGKFDEGWDVWRQRVFERQLEMGVIPPGTELAPRNPGVQPWDELSADEQAFACRLQEAFAAFLDHTDAQVGRLLDALEEQGHLDDTLVFALSDNGASQEGNSTGVMDEFRYFNNIPEDLDSVKDRLDDIGTRRSFSNYPWGWAQVGNTPGKRYKQNTHGGGVRDPLIVSWPNGIDTSCQGQIRTQFHHVIDIAPTVLEILGEDAPEQVKGIDQQPIEGTSLAYTFAPGAVDAGAVPSRKTSQYFEMFGHRAIWSGGWKAVTFHEPGTPLDADTWELYHLDEDFSEMNDLATAKPEKLAELVELFWSEAEQYGVLPIDTGRLRGLFAGHPTRGTPRARDTFVYRPPVDRIPMDTAPSFGARSWVLRADVSRASADVDGVLLAVGTVNNGLVAYIKDNRLVYDHNYFGTHSVIRSAELPAGDVTLGIDFDRVRRGPARVRLWADDDLLGEGVVPEVSVMISSIGMDIGRNPSGISDDYVAPFDFGGEIHRVEVATVRALSEEDELAAEIRTALGTQ
ncbi:MAG: arylsulfatase [Actinomycetota bacterium]|jgi:arylsulfatase A-like enzyme|nr:arylsulfatase [Actinomycetota bacterium]